MNRNLIIVMAGGFLIAVLVAFIVQASLSGGDKEVAAVEQAPRVRIVVASTDMKVGDELNDKNIKWQEWPENAIFTGAVIQEGEKRPSEMVSGRLVRPVSAGEPITETALVDPNANFVAARLGKGMRAVAVDVSAVKMAGGFVGPGDFVDVVLTYRETIRYDGPDTWVNDFLEMNFDKMAAETILQNVKVLAVDQTASRDDKSGNGAKVGKTVTLEVDPAATEVLILAQSMGDLSLSLRGLGDDIRHVRTYPIVTDARVTGITGEIYKEINRLKKTTGQDSNIVRIYNGYELSETPVRQ